ncbi:MAG: hypothetical protein DKM50_07560 [Candidatus Margulisiibacteriota bacterium]|nr:MAG: hypothetical protein A2X43_13640 [Candidatus Margulisbacteria bacterium GWD2_39_127]PZM79747.1 MAG: hypothetical protein DKM50_07560 [Candidatus Margulisiibacteriota bacterium]HAR62142.1 hypothetical protein [Candidatus Margulisiibacteriota bacterium]HCT85135.1 hypothetical protein [Candidatus Margulisiibacteriota bacterium]HCY36699.1 hypothetical protein [Candidatus Margulisiibacteriota bacterium]
MWNTNASQQQNSPEIVEPVKDSRALLQQAVNNIEKMAFLPVSEAHLYYSKIKIKTPIKGEMVIFVTESLAKELTNSIYGLTSEDNPLQKERVKDAVSEMLNIIAGQFMRTILPLDQDFTIGLPITEQCEEVSGTSSMIQRFYTVNNNLLPVAIKGKELINFFENNRSR